MGNKMMNPSSARSSSILGVHFTRMMQIIPEGTFRKPTTPLSWIVWTIQSYGYMKKPRVSIPTSYDDFYH